MIWYEKTDAGKLMVSRIEKFLDYHPLLEKGIFSDKRLYNCLGKLLEESPVLFKERIIFKYPDSGGYKPHQDIYSVAYNLPQREIYAVVAIFIDDADEENGCMYFSPSEHKNGILAADEKGVMYDYVYKDFKWEPIICLAGDVVIFDSYLPHYSEMNESNRQRRVIYFPFQKKSTMGLTREQYYIRKRQIAPPQSKSIDINNLNKQNQINFRHEPKKA
jgi:ectoine hydroxylase-related dioxygenase (phytanoyl-CoA dioxygenase family)